ncbi:MAG: prolyl oligopeptidase family serine peptidase [Verrucomicrobiota bacterium]
MRYFIVGLFLFGQVVRAEEALFPGRKSPWHGYTMFQDAGSRIVVPKQVAEGKPWVWRARFWGHQPQFDIRMLEKGYHIVYRDVGGLFGAPAAVERWNAFYRTLVEQHGFAKKVILEGMSRGGLIIYNWAAANPEKVAAIYGDAPVMDIKSWPGADHKGVHKAYGFKNADEARAHRGNPLDRLEPLARAGIPIIHVVGDQDTVVPVAENTAIAEKRYRELGGVFEVIHKDVGHHPHSLKDPTPLVDFMVKHAATREK